MPLAPLERRDDADHELAVDAEAGARRRPAGRSRQTGGRLDAAANDRHALAPHAGVEEPAADLFGDRHHGGDGAIVEQIGPRTAPQHVVHAARDDRTRSEAPQPRAHRVGSRGVEVQDMRALARDETREAPCRHHVEVVPDR